MHTRPRILIAENDATNVQLLTDICVAEDIDVLVAQDGDETLKMIQEDPPDLVLLDVMMPARDGFQVLQELRNRPATRMLPIILVTAVSDDDSIRRGYQLGANDYITKPFKVVELVTRMKTLLKAAAYDRITLGSPRWDVGDHRSLVQILEEQLSRSEIHPLTLLLFQLQNLDSVEQAHDRVTATQVLQHLIGHLRSLVRGVDSVYFLPPDQLAFILVETDLDAAESVAQRLSSNLHQPLSVEDRDFSFEGRWAVVTASGDEKPNEIIQRSISKLNSPS